MLRLKKDAVPKIFYCDENRHDMDNEHIEPIEPNIHLDQQENNEPYEVTGIEYRQLKQQFITEKAEWNMLEQKLEKQIKELKHNVDEQKKQIKFLSQKLQRETKTKETLNKLLEDLHAQKLLDKENLVALQVIMMQIY